MSPQTVSLSHKSTNKAWEDLLPAINDTISKNGEWNVVAALYRAIWNIAEESQLSDITLEILMRAISKKARENMANNRT